MNSPKQSYYLPITLLLLILYQIQVFLSYVFFKFLYLFFVVLLYSEFNNIIYGQLEKFSGIFPFELKGHHFKALKHTLNYFTVQ